MTVGKIAKKIEILLKFLKNVKVINAFSCQSLKFLYKQKVQLTGSVVTQ